MFVLLVRSGTSVFVWLGFFQSDTAVWNRRVLESCNHFCSSKRVKIQHGEAVAVLFRCCLWVVRISRRKKGWGLSQRCFGQLWAGMYRVRSMVFLTWKISLSLLFVKESELLYAAKVYRDDRLRKKADSMAMDNCKELERLTSLYRGGWTTIIDIYLYICPYLL